MNGKLDEKICAKIFIQDYVQCNFFFSDHFLMNVRCKNVEIFLLRLYKNTGKHRAQ